MQLFSGINRKLDLLISTVRSGFMSLQDQLDAAVKDITDVANQAVSLIQAQNSQISTSNAKITDLSNQIAQLQATAASGNVDPTAFANDLAQLKSAHDAIMATLPQPVSPPAVPPAPAPATSG